MDLIAPRLPPELSLGVVNYLSSHDLLNWCLTCRRMYDTYICILYETIDLHAYHIDQTTQTKQKTEPFYIPYWRSGSYNAEHKALYFRQSVLIASLDRAPKLAEYVRTLRWSTVFDEEWISPGDEDENDCHNSSDGDNREAERLAVAKSSKHFNYCNGEELLTFFMAK